MKLTSTVCLSAFLLAAMAPAVSAESSPIPSSSDTFTEFSVVDGWTVYSDSETGHCLVERVDDAGNAMQMGLTKDQKYAYVGVFTQGDLDVKKKQDIAIAVDGAVFTGKVHGIKSKKLAGDYSGGYVLTNNPNLVTAISEGKQLIAFPEEPVAFVIDLTGTKVAIEEAIKCNAAISG